MRASSSRGQDFSAWLEVDADVRRLGHVYGPPNRHFTAFVNPDVLLDRENKDRIAEALFRTVRGAMADSGSRFDYQQDSPVSVAIWYVGSEVNDAKIAFLVQEFLRTEGVDVVDVMPIPRHYNGQEWEFPGTISDLDRPIGVLIVQFWTITGATLPQMVRLAAKSGASWIAAVCLLNQLSDNKADELVMCRTVAGSVQNVYHDVGNNRERDVPVATSFVTSSGITAFNSALCPICSTRKKYDIDKDAAPNKLSSHAELVRKQLSSQKWEDVSRGTAVDLFGVPVTGAEISDYLRWRELLFRALHSLSYRRQLISKLYKLTADSTTQQEYASLGLVRLLAAEQQWLRLRPLIFKKTSDLLANICHIGLMNENLSPWIRVQYAMVMASARPDRLVRLLPELMTGFDDEIVLLDQMLLDCYTLLSPSEGDPPVGFGQLRQGLQACRDDMEARLRESVDSVAGNYLPVVRSLLAIVDYRILVNPKSPQAAWERLRENLVRPVMRHELDGLLHVVTSFVEDCEWIKPSLGAAQNAIAAWGDCADKLGQPVLVNLPPLRDIFAGDFVTSQFGQQNQQRLLALTTEAGVGQLQSVADSLLILSRGAWLPDDASWQAQRLELLERINWWKRIFITAHFGDHERPAMLVDFIDSAPAKLDSCTDNLISVYKVHANIIARDQGSKRVFCPQKLLDQIFTHLLDNINRHRATKMIVPSLEIEYISQTPDILQMIVRNSGTRPSNRPGRGLQALNEKLKPFGGSLTHQAFLGVESSDWTFAVAVTLPAWRGA